MYHTEVGIESPKCLEGSTLIFGLLTGEKQWKATIVFIVELTFWKSFGLCRADLGAQQRWLTDPLAVFGFSPLTALCSGMLDVCSALFLNLQMESRG